MNNSDKPASDGAIFPDSERLSGADTRGEVRGLLTEASSPDVSGNQTPETQAIDPELQKLLQSPASEKLAIAKELDKKLDKFSQKLGKEMYTYCHCRGELDQRADREFGCSYQELSNQRGSVYTQGIEETENNVRKLIASAREGKLGPGALVLTYQFDGPALRFTRALQTCGRRSREAHRKELGWKSEKNRIPCDLSSQQDIELVCEDAGGFLQDYMRRTANWYNHPNHHYLETPFDWKSVSEEDRQIIFQALIDKRYLLGEARALFPKDFIPNLKVGTLLSFGSCEHHSGSISGSLLVLPTGRLAVISRYSGERCEEGTTFWGVTEDWNLEPFWSARSASWENESLNEPTPEEIQFVRVYYREKDGEEIDCPWEMLAECPADNGLPLSEEPALRNVIEESRQTKLFNEKNGNKEEREELKMTYCAEDQQDDTDDDPCRIERDFVDELRDGTYVGADEGMEEQFDDAENQEDLPENPCTTISAEQAREMKFDPTVIGAEILWKLGYAIEFEPASGLGQTVVVKDREGKIVFKGEIVS